MSYVNSVTVYPSSVTIAKGKWYYEAYASISSDCPECAEVEWYSNSPSIASVNKTTGYIYGVNIGTTRVYAEATDGSGKKDYITVTVTAPISVTGVSVYPASKTMNVGDEDYLCETVYPSNATNKTVTWHSSDDSVAEINTYSGKVIAKKAGIATITATTADGGYYDTCEVWVHGKTPVFLIHGRTSNSTDVWGVNNNIPSGKNDHFNPDINAVSLNSKKYTDINSQTLGSLEPNNGNSDTDYPCNLGNKLIDAGYKKNINLFAFNYPNEDAVKYSAQKFEVYIDNLIAYVRTSGSNEMKACFYASRNDYNNNNYKINIVGHSMGGLVARYYIENLYYDHSVSKLITICTPHWGSGYAELSSDTGIEHKLCDHDLDFDSAMFGGSNSTTVNCDKGTCPESNYIVTSALQYQRQRSTKYYAIAGIDYDATYVNLNDYTFEMPTNFTTYQEITDYLVSKNVYKVGGKDLHIDYPPNPKSIGDNMVGFMSQIGWTEDSSSAPNKKISMEKIFVDVDTNGGNGGETFVWEAIMEWLFGDALLHSKIPHRTPIVEKTIEFLGE